MKNQEELKLSSDWTNAGLYGGSFIILLMIPVLGIVIQEQELHFGMVFSGILYLVLIGFLVYQFIYVCDASIVDDKIVLKKKFRPAKIYSFDKIGHPTSFRLKSTRYITVEMKNNDNTIEKYLIINSKSLLSFENKDAEQVLIDRIPRGSPRGECGKV